MTVTAYESTDESGEPPSSSMIVEVTLDDEVHMPDGMSIEGLRARIVEAVRVAAVQRGFLRGSIAIALVDDETIRGVNKQHLGHDYATDVISFGYEQDGDLVEGELIVSVETAILQAERIGWRWDSELLLYIVHGTLHVAGMDDQTTPQRQSMRDSESQALSSIGIHDVNDFHADRFAALDGTSASQEAGR